MYRFSTDHTAQMTCVQWIKDELCAEKDITDLKMTKDAPAEDTSALEDTKQDCPAKAAKFEAATNSRSEEGSPCEGQSSDLREDRRC